MAKMTWKNVWFVDVIPSGKGINATNSPVVAVEFSLVPGGMGHEDPILEFFTVAPSGEFVPLAGCECVGCAFTL